MKSIIKSYIYLLMLLPGLILASCIKDDRDDCVDDEDLRRLLYITVRDVTTGEDITSSEDLENVSLYLFDQNSDLRYIIDVPVDDVRNRIPVDITYTGMESGYATIWSNLNELMTVVGIDGRTYEDIMNLAVEINENELDEGYYFCPGDLFFGYEPFSFTSTSSTGRATTTYTDNIDIKRKNGRLNITVRGLDTSKGDEGYFFCIQTLNNGYNFIGDPTFEDLQIKEAGEFIANGDFISPDPYLMIHAPRNAVFTDDYCVKVDINRKNTDGSYTTLGTAIKDVNGKYVFFESDKTVNVLIEFNGTGDMEVYIETTPWGEIYQWETW